MKKIIIAMAAIAAAFTMASCNKQLVEPENNPIDGNCIITASTESSLTKTALKGDDEKGYEVVWSEGDSFKIGDNTFTLTAGEGTTNGSFEGTAPLDGTYDVYYPSTYDGSTWPAEQTYTEGNITGSPMKAEVTITDGKASESIKFKNEGGILRLTVKGTATVKSINISATELSKAIILNCGNGVELDNTNGTVFHIAMPLGSYTKTSIQFTTTSGSTCTKTLKSSALAIERSKITPASFTASFITTGTAEPLPGKFSVAEGTQVSFAQGNLICDISDETQPKWGFYENQYDFATGYSSTLISLFNWGYHPTESLYPGSTISNTINHLDSNYLPQDKDWGSQIGDGRAWRTLTGEEWKYLFETRTNAADKYGYATVGGVYGLIILPDSFIDPMKNGGSGAFVPTSTTGWTANLYATGGDWEAMEAAGAVFLPAAGYRSGSSLSYVGSNGRYWSSSHKTNSSPYHLFFDSSSVNSNSYGGATTGMSVRLVTNMYTVTFNMNGHGTALADLEHMMPFSTIPEPPTPAAQGCAFNGWYKDEELKTLWDFENDTVTSDITLYAGWIEDALPSKFTINSDGEQVFFSQGNLYYDGSEFQFEAKQYSYRVYDSGSNTWGLFGWPTSASNYGMSTSKDNAVYSGGFKDWGKAIDENGTWRTLTKDEWSYLLFTRKQSGFDHPWTHSIKYGGQLGLVIYPDEYDGEELTSGTEYTDENFPQGCLFLPCAGGRKGDTSCYYQFGYYWSSTAADNGEVCVVHTYQQYVNISLISERTIGFAVRLVSDVTK